MNSSTIRSRHTRLAWTAWFLFVNALLALLIGLRYLPWMSVPDAYTLTYVSTLLPSQFFLLAGLVGAPLLAAAMILPSRLLIPLSIAWATLGLGLLALDTVVYALYRFHLSGFVLELALGGGTEVFSLSVTTWLTALAAVIACLTLETVIATVLWRFRPSGRGLGVILTLTLGSQVAVHGWHAWADARYDQRITSVTRHVPLYYATTAKRFLNRHGLVDAEQVREDSLGGVQSDLNATNDSNGLDYPPESLSCRKPDNPPNVLIIVLDSVRWDMLDPRWMPRIHSLSENALVFDNHSSNGNATKPGIFSLFYGLPGNYWDAFTQEQQPPLLVSRMQELGYDTEILGSATLVSPAFDRNVFASIENLRLETPGETAWQRDRRITRDWLRFMDDHHSEPSPFFGFLFYDTTHSYKVPEDYPRFKPYDNANRIALDNQSDPEPFMNAYKTAIHYVDNQVQRVLDDLRERNLMDETIVLITSDHGEEFNDNGMNYWGHGSNFSRYQLRVPLVVHWPGRQAKTIDRQTQHFDVAPTLLRKALGCEDTPAKTIASDYGLFENRNPGWRIAHSYMDYALILESYRVVKHASGNVDVVGEDLKPVRQYNLPGGTVNSVLNEMSRFFGQ